MHAHNPVDWYPWGEEALTKARKEKKLIFLSVGYSSCYWCHVMERQSFMDEEIAAELNRHFVCIKVDREERPDIDLVYMRALEIYSQLAGQGGGGGWPMTVFLTPDAKPVFGATYLPPRDREGQRGLLSLINRAQESWTAEPDKLQQGADKIAGYVEDSLRKRPVLVAVEPDRALLDKVQDSLAGVHDGQYGGFGSKSPSEKSPKFPQSPMLIFLLHRARGDDAKQAAAAKRC